MGKALIFDGITVSNPITTVTITDISEDAKTIGGYFTDLPQKKLIALDVLITDLKECGAWEEMRYIALPMLATNVSEASQNILMKNDRVPNTQYLSFNNGQLFGSSTIAQISTLSNEMISTPKTMDFTIEDKSIGWHSDPTSASTMSYSIGALRLYVDGTDSGTTQIKRYDEATQTDDKIATVSTFAPRYWTSMCLYNDTDNSAIKGLRVLNDNLNVLESQSTTYYPLSGTFYDSLTIYSNAKNYGIDYLWVGEKMTSSQLLGVHTAFSKFLNTLDIN